MLKLNIQLFGGRGATSSTGNYDMSLEYYVSGQGMWINNYLRGLDDEIDFTDDDKVYLKELDILTNDKIKDEILYRTTDASAIFGNMTDGEYANMVEELVYGVYSKGNGAYSQGIAKQVNNRINNAINKDHTEKGFMSTTKSLGIAENNKYFFGSTKPIIMEIHTNKKTRGLDIMKKPTKRIREVEARDPQKEVLLARNQKYKVESVGSKNGNIYVKVRLK